MFAKSLFNQNLLDAKALANDLDKLKEEAKELVASIKSILNVNLAKENEKKIFTEISQKKPLSQTDDNQEVLKEKFRKKLLKSYYRTLTERRDLLFKNFCQLYPKLNVLCSRAQATLLHIMELKNEAHNRSVWIRSGNLTQKITDIIHSNIINCFKELKNSYCYLKEIANTLHLSTVLTLAFIPDKASDVVTKMLYGIRGALYEDNENYQLIKDMIGDCK